MKNIVSDNHKSSFCVGGKCRKNVGLTEISLRAQKFQQNGIYVSEFSSDVLRIPLIYLLSACKFAHVQHKLVAMVECFSADVTGFARSPTFQQTVHQHF